MNERNRLTVRQLAKFLSSLPESDQDKEVLVTYDSDVCTIGVSDCVSPAEPWDEEFVVLLGAGP